MLKPLDPLRFTTNRYKEPVDPLAPAFRRPVPMHPMQTVQRAAPAAPPSPAAPSPARPAVGTVFSLGESPLQVGGAQSVAGRPAPGTVFSLGGERPAPTEGDFLDRVFGEGSVGDVWQRGGAMATKYLLQLPNDWLARQNDNIGELYNALGVGAINEYALNLSTLRMEKRTGGDSFVRAAANTSAAFVNRMQQTAKPAEGVLSDPLSLGNFYDPRRIYALLGEGIPSTAAIGIASYLSGGTASALMTASSSEQFLQYADKFETETGRTVDLPTRFYGALAVGVGTTVLEKIGLSQLFKAARIPGLSGKLMQGLIMAPVSEGGTETLQEAIMLGAESVVQSTGRRFAVTDNAAQRLGESFYSGMLIGETMGAGSIVATVGVKPKPELTFMSVESDANGVLGPRFRVNNGSSALVGTTVGPDALRAAGIAVPPYQRALLAAEIKAAAPQLGDGEVEFTLRLMEPMAASLGLSVDEYIEQTGLTVGDKVPTAGSALWQVESGFKNMGETVRASYQQAVKMLSDGELLETVTKSTGFSQTEEGWRYRLPETGHAFRPPTEDDMRFGENLGMLFGFPVTTSSMTNAARATLDPMSGIFVSTGEAGKLKLVPKYGSIAIAVGITNFDAANAFEAGNRAIWAREQLRSKGIATYDGRKLDQSLDIVAAVIEQANVKVFDNDALYIPKVPTPAARRTLPRQPGPVWYSKLYDELSVPGRLPKKMTGAQLQKVVEGLVSQGKVKAEEVEWSPVSDFYGEDFVNPQDVLSLQKNYPSMVTEQVNEANNPVDVEYRARLQEVLAGLPANERVTKEEELQRIVYRMTSGGDLQDFAPSEVYRQDAQLGGSTDYYDDMSDVLVQAGFPPLPFGDEIIASNETPFFKNYQAPGKSDNYREFLIATPSRRVTNKQPLVSGGTETIISDGPVYMSPHWPQKNNTFHIRVTDRVDRFGRKVLFVEEVQSDRHQEGYEFGYAGEPKTERQQGLFDRYAAFKAAKATNKAAHKVYTDTYPQRYEAVRTANDALENRILSRLLIPFANGADIGNPQEFLLTLPDGPVAHIRAQIDAEMAVTFSDFDESAWPSSPMREPLISDPEFNLKSSTFAKLERWADGEWSEPPNAPLRTNWPEVSIKRILRLAAEEGYDAITFPDGATVQESVGGVEEGQSYFYDTVVPSRLKALAKVKNLDVFEIDGKSWRGVEITDALFDRVLQAQPLFQMGAGKIKGAYDASVAGKKVISLFKTADVSTLVHELGHFFRDTLGAKDLADAEAAFGVVGGKWDRAAEEVFSRSFERFVRDGKVKNKAMWPTLQKMRDYMSRVYINTKGTAIADDLSKEHKAFFDKMMDYYTSPAAATPKERNKIWTWAVDAVVTEAPWKRAGQPLTGRAIRDHYSTIERHQLEWEDNYAQMFRFMKSDNAIVRLIAEKYESRTAFAAVMAGPDSPDKKALSLYHKLITGSLHDYQQLGGLQKGFVENMEGRVRAKIQKGVKKGSDPLDVANALAGDSVAAAKLGWDTQRHNNMIKLANSLVTLKDVQYSHIPLAWFEALEEKSADGGNRVLQVMAQKERSTLTLSELLADGTLDINDISAKDIFASYAQRKGKDMAILKIRAAAELEGAAVPMGPGGTPPKGYERSSHPLFRDYAVTETVKSWVATVTAPSGGMQFIRDLLNSQKLLSFWNPLVMTTMNLVQFSFVTLTTPERIPKAVVKGFMDWANKTDDFYEALDNGLSSQPFALPFGDFRRRFEAIERYRGEKKYEVTGELLKAAFGGILGAAAGSILGDVGLGAKLGVMGALADFNRSIPKTYASVRYSTDSLDFIKNLAKAPVELIMPLMEKSSDVAWSLDMLLRVIAYNVYRQEDVSVQEAADNAANAFGNYASVPRTTSQNLNMFLYTPTFKIATFKMITDSVGALRKEFAGVGSIPNQQKARLIVNLGAVLFGYHMFMVANGWEPEEFGRKYVLPVTTNAEGDALAQGVDRELVRVFSGPHDLVLKFPNRAISSFTDPTVENALVSFYNKNRWEIHPTWRLLEDQLRLGTKSNGEPIYSQFDSFGLKMGKSALYTVSNYINLIEGVERAQIESEGQVSDISKRDFGKLEQILSGAIMMQYTQDPAEVRMARKMQRLYKQFEKDITPKQSEIMEGMTRQQYQERYLDKMPDKVARYKDGIEFLMRELAEAQYRTDAREELQDMPNARPEPARPAPGTIFTLE